MINRFSNKWLVGLSIYAVVLATALPAASYPITYPVAAQDEQYDYYHGTKVRDSYRWLEDLDSPSTRKWITEENQITNTYLDSISQRKQIRQLIMKLWNYERYSSPFQLGNQYFYSHNDGLQNQSVFFVSTDLSRPGRVLLDPNTLSADGTVAVGGVNNTIDGKLMAYALSKSGSDWQEWHVRDVATGKDLPDVVRWSKFSGASWLHDGSGFYYSRYDEPKEGSEFKSNNYFQKVYFHKLGEKQEQDKLIYERKDHKDWFLEPIVSEDGRYLIISIGLSDSKNNLVYYCDLTEKEPAIKPLISEATAQYDFVNSVGSKLYFRTTLNAPNWKVDAIDVSNNERSLIVAEGPDALVGASTAGGKLFCEYLKDTHSAVVVHSIDGLNPTTIQLPIQGSASNFGALQSSKELFYSITNYTTPPEIYRYNIASGKSEMVFDAKLTFDPRDYESKLVFYKSKDGTKVPLWICSRKGIVLNGKNPTLLYGYGGFDIPITPSYSTSTMAWMAMGGVYAVANLRGGSEYGESWHEAGMLKNKQNVFDDFISAAEYLIESKYTSPGKLAIRGGSNGGLLVGATMTQRPDLFGAALPDVGVLDMLRFDKFTIGYTWCSEYGSPADADMFKVLYKYSPLHSVKSGTKYPATMISTADHDDRVFPAHSFKFAAALQACQAGKAPILIRIDTKAGHGAGKPISKRIDDYTDEYAFLWDALEAEPIK